MIQNEIKTELHSSIKPKLERVLSNASTFCSLKEKESEEFKSDKTMLNSRRYSNTYPKNKLRKSINIFDSDIESKVYFKSKDDKKIKNKKKISKEKSKEKVIIKPSEKPKEINRNNLNIKVSKDENKVKISDFYSQNYDIACMKKQPPKLPDIFYHAHNINNINKSIKNDTYGEINKGAIGNIFYSHLMTFKNKKKNIIKSCVTQRNQKKLLTIIYYKQSE